MYKRQGVIIEYKEGHRLLIEFGSHDVVVSLSGSISAEQLEPCGTRSGEYAAGRRPPLPISPVGRQLGGRVDSAERWVQEGSRPSCVAARSAGVVESSPGRALLGPSRHPAWSIAGTQRQHPPGKRALLTQTPV